MYNKLFLFKSNTVNKTILNTASPLCIKSKCPRLIHPLIDWLCDERKAATFSSTLWMHVCAPAAFQCHLETRCRVRVSCVHSALSAFQTVAPPVKERCVRWNGKDARSRRHNRRVEDGLAVLGCCSFQIFISRSSCPSTTLDFLKLFQLLLKRNARRSLKRVEVFTTAGIGIQTVLNVAKKKSIQIFVYQIDCIYEL